MEKSCHSSGDSTTSNNSISTSNYKQHQHHHHHHHNNNNNSNSRDQDLKQLNKISHKISKDSRPPPIRKYPLDLHHNHHHHHQQQNQQQQHQHQPPVYNINKSDFRDVVQKLTGSPAHERNFSTPPPIHPPKPQSSRLQRIRPPPLANLSPHPPPPPPLPNTILPPTTTTNAARFPSSPLPPFPAVHAAAESPISAYMRYLQSSMLTVDSESKRFSSSGVSPLMSPRWNNPNSVSPRWNNNINAADPSRPQAQLQQQQILVPSPTAAAMSPSQFLMPSSPFPFGKLPSPRSPYPLLSPTFLFSPTAGQLGFPQFPPSPRLPVPSPRWRDL